MTDSIIATNHMKHMLRAGKSVVGTMICEIRQPSVMQLMKNAGLDFVIVDNEHGVFNPETIADLSRTARYLDLTCIVRVTDMTYSHIAQALDGGAMGIMLPRVYTANQVQEALQMMKFPPLGQRGNSLSRGYTNFKSGSPSEAMATSNAETMFVVQVETKEAVDNIEEIVAIPGVDVTLVGPNDLAIALGVPGQLDSPVMRAAIEKMITACQQNGVYPAIHMNDLNLAVYWAQKGMRVLSSNSETGLMVKAASDVAAAIRQGFGA